MSAKKPILILFGDTVKEFFEEVSNYFGRKPRYTGRPKLRKEKVRK